MSDIQETTAQPDVVSDATSSPETPNPTPQAQPEATPAPEAVSVESAPSQTLAEFLSDDLKNVKALSNFKDVDGLAKSYVHLNGLLGKKFDELSHDELDSYYSKLGRPEKADEYKLPTGADTEIEGWYRDSVFKLGLNQTQAKDLMESYTELEKKKMDEMNLQSEQVTNDWVQSIKQEFGTAFEQRLDTAKKAVKEYGGEELKEYLNETGLGNHPAMIKAFAKIGQSLSEDSMAIGEVTSKFGTTPKEAMQKVANLKRDPNFMKQYKTAMAPGHKEAVKEIEDLYRIAYPDE